ncbi:LETM1 domain-containing protein 1 isoform X1 [Brachionichthys hirsutus]|uniref:LETM1 domain-containing protein 1 isoform X1 n=1 Tax=Brachionichthys hirsutus TaxID=412623 RepID=UPI003604927E
MALPGLGLCSRLSLIRFRGGTDGTVIGFYSHRASCEFRHYSSTEPRRGVGQYITSSIRSINSKYEAFLKRRFPRVYTIHFTFTQGSKLIFQDVKDVMRIRTKMASEGLQVCDLPYRDMEKLRQTRKYLMKTLPLLVMSLPPFANYLVFVLMYFFPRQLLIPHFWTPRQKVAFWGSYHSQRVRHHLPLLKELETLSQQVKRGPLQKRLQVLCAQVQRGRTPKVSEILGVRDLYSGPPLNVLSVTHKRRVGALLFLSPRLPGFLVERRLSRHALELLQLDRALSNLGPHQLDESELRQACYLRGLDPYPLSISQCREWLSTWLQVSSSLRKSEQMLLLHSIVFLSANYPSGAADRKPPLRSAQKPSRGDKDGERAVLGSRPSRGDF